MTEEQYYPENHKSKAHGLSLKEMFFKYLRFWPLFVISIALSMVVALIYLRWSTNIYKASGVLLVQTDKKSSGLDKLEQAMTVDPMKDVQTEIEILHSRPMMQRVVNALNLNFSYTKKNGIKEENAYKSLPFVAEAVKMNDSTSGFALNIKFENPQSFRVNESSQLYTFGQNFSTPAGTFRLNRTGGGDVPAEVRVTWTPTLHQAINLAGSIDITPKMNTGIVNISMESSSPQLAADVVNQLMVEYGKVNIEEKNVTTYQKLQFIEEETQQLLRQLDSMNDRLVAFREKYKIVDPQVQSNAYLNRIENNLEKLNEQRVMVQNVTRLEEYLRNPNVDAPVPSTLGIQDLTLNQLIDAYTQSMLEQKKLAENAPPGNLLVKQATTKTETLRQKLLENISNLKTSFTSMVGNLQSTSGAAMGQVSGFPAQERELGDIKRDMESKLVIYNNMLVSKEQAQIALASTISNTKVVQDALPDYTPVKPRRSAVRLLALMIGLVVPISIIVVMELLNDKVTSRHDIENFTEAAILADIGHSNGNEALVVTKHNRKIIAEQFRILRSNLQFVLRNTQKPVILVTSSFSGEGKSFISTNTGAAISLTGQKTVILEFDIRKPKVLEHLGLQKRQGLTNYLLGSVRLEDLAVPVPGYENLFVIPCGPLPPNPAELLLDPKLDELFAYLKENFDAVVMDTAPVGMVSDALTLSKFADCTLFVVREKYTLKKQVVAIDEYHRDGRLPKVSLVINDSRTHTSGGNGYGSGYFEDDQPVKSRWFGWLAKKNGVHTKTKKPTEV